MAHIRIRPNGRIQFDLHLYGRRFREGTKLMATPKNLSQAKAILKQMNAEIDLNTFQYRDYFPDSKKCPFLKRYNEKNTLTVSIRFSMILPINGLTAKKANGKAAIKIRCATPSTVILFPPLVIRSLMK